MGLLINPEHANLNEAELVHPMGQKEFFNLHELQGFVGGYFELATIKLDWLEKDGWPYPSMAVNEEGRLKNLPFNAVASSLHGSVIVGNALLLERGELD